MTDSTHTSVLKSKIENRAARVAVVGLGYVGLPLAVELASAGFDVLGIDRDADKVRRINDGECYIPDISLDMFQTVRSDGRLRATTDFSALSTCDAISICVPTPLRKTRDPDLSYVIDASETIAQHLRPGVLVILESTTYPGTTEEAVLPSLETSGLRVGEDFFLCFSPERIDPGNQRFQTHNIPKVVGGVTAACTDLGCLYYSQIVGQTVPVGSTQTAEMVKLLENTFRMINIGLANEIAILCDRLGINVWEVIEAAATKPFGFMPFFPGPGLGGHCIPVDPHYLSWKTRQFGYEPRFIELAAQINGQMPRYVVEKVQAGLNSSRKAVHGSTVHVVGIAYKAGVSDTREAPAIDIIVMLRRLGAVVSYTDPYVPEIVIEGEVLKSETLLRARTADCTLIVTDHPDIDYESFAELAPLIVDTRNAMRGITNREDIVGLSGPVRPRRAAYGQRPVQTQAVPGD